MKKGLVSTIVTIAIVYSCLWFLISKGVENKAYKYLDQLKQEKILDEYSGNVYITGFPFSFNINLAHPRIKFHKSHAKYNAQCDMLFDGNLSLELRFFSNKISIKPRGDIHLKGNLNNYNFDSTIGGKNSSYQVRLSNSLILTALKGSIRAKSKKPGELFVSLVDKILIHNENLRVLNKLNNTLLFYADKIDFKLAMRGIGDDLAIRYSEHISNAEFHKEFRTLRKEVLSLPFVRENVNHLDINIRNYFDVFSFEKLGKINHKINLKINTQGNTASVEIKELRLDDDVYDINATGKLDLGSAGDVDLKFESKFSQLWYELMRVYADRLRLKEFKKTSFGGGKSIISSIFNAIIDFLLPKKRNYAIYVPRLHHMGKIYGDIDAKYSVAKDDFRLNLDGFKIRANRFSIDANGNAQTAKGKFGDKYRLKALLTNYPHIVDELVNYVNRVSKGTGQIFLIVGKQVTISQNMSDRIKFFLREISDNPGSKSKNLRLTIVNKDGGKCPAVGKYSSREFCNLWQGFVFNLLLSKIAEDLNPAEMLKALKNPLAIPETIVEDTGKIAEGIIGGVFGLIGQGK